MLNMWDLRQNSTQNYVRLAFNAVYLSKVNTKFKAKYVRSMLKLNAKYVRSTPKFKAKLCKISVECVEFM